MMLGMYTTTHHMANCNGDICKDSVGKLSNVRKSKRYGAHNRGNGGVLDVAGNNF